MIYILGKYRKNSRFLYFLANISRLCIPGLVYRLRRLWLLRPSNIEAAKHLKLRADYYCKLEAPCKLGVEASKFRFNLFGGHPRNYQFDLGQYLRYWNRQFRIHYRMGDNTHLLDGERIRLQDLVEPGNRCRRILYWPYPGCNES